MLFEALSDEFKYLYTVVFVRIVYLLYYYF
jgi:hypothetical protein